MKESENTKNSSNAIGKTLTVIAILVGLAACCCVFQSSSSASR
jgi:hypothetical protein